MNIKKTLKEVYKNINICGNSSIGRVLAFQAGSCGFESRLPLKTRWARIVVSTQDFHSCKRGSIPLPTTKKYKKE